MFDDKIIDAVVQDLRRIDLPDLGIIDEKRQELRKQGNPETHRRKQDQEAMPRDETLVDFRLTRFGNRRRRGYPVHDHRHQRDDDAGQQALAELGLAHCRQHFPADVRGTTDDRCNDNHRERRHCGLVDAE